MIYSNRKEISIEKKAKKTAGPLFEAGDIDVTILQTIPYQYPKRKITVELTSQEFSCVCPFSGLPDFACITIQYVPRKKLIELKSLKYYLYAFRNVKIYNEHVVNKILQDLTKVLTPHEMTITGEFTARGGVSNKVCAQYRKQR